jgi:hypothetical protein
MSLNRWDMLPGGTDPSVPHPRVTASQHKSSGLPGALRPPRGLAHPMRALHVRRWNNRPNLPGGGWNMPGGGLNMPGRGLGGGGLLRHLFGGRHGSGANITKGVGLPSISGGSTSSTLPKMKSPFGKPLPPVLLKSPRPNINFAPPKIGNNARPTSPPLPPLPTDGTRKPRQL